MIFLIDWRGIFRSNQLEVVILEKLENRLIFGVKNGKNLLRQEFGTIGNEGFRFLTYDGLPLTKANGDEELSPTCVHFLAAGYGLEKCTNEVLESVHLLFNTPFQNLEDSFEKLKPLLGLLPTGIYSLVDTELIPTDGDGNFFWKRSTEFQRCIGTTDYYYESGSWDGVSSTPQFLIATQSPKMFNMERANFYMNQENMRSIAIHFQGFLCALLDGHHKAVACTLKQQTVPTLLIESGYYSMPYNKPKETSIIFPSHIHRMIGKYPSFFRNIENFTYWKNISKNEISKMVSLVEDSFDTYPWTQEILNSAKYFPTIVDHAHLEWAGDTSQTRLEKIMSGEEKIEEYMLVHICHALALNESPMFVPFAKYISTNEIYSKIWPDIFVLLAKIRSQEIEDFFINYLVYDEGRRPNVTKIVDGYLNASS